LIFASSLHPTGFGFSQFKIGEVMRLIKAIVIIFFFVILPGCVSQLSASGMLVKDASQNMVDKCGFVSQFTASDMGGADIEQRLENVKIKVRNQSGKTGATHVLWGQVSMGGLLNNVPVITGQAYKCPSS
jgi:hypothetical protein